MHETEDTMTQSGRDTKLATAEKRSCSMRSLMESSLSMYRSRLGR